MLKLYHVPITRSTRIIWLCEKLALPLNVETILLTPDYQFSDEWRAKNPVGKARRAAGVCRQVVATYRQGA